MSDVCDTILILFKAIEEKNKGDSVDDVTEADLIER